MRTLSGAVVAVATWLLLAAPPAHADHVIQRPTAEASSSYTCPMRCEGPKTYDTPGTCPVCGMHLKLVSTRPYRVDVTRAGTSLRAGEETTLRITIRDPEDAPVRSLEIVHEKPLHLLITSADLAWFAHEHPERMPDGTFELRMTFPAPGRYTLFHDFTPERVGMQVVAVELTVPGEPPRAVALTPDHDRPKTVDGYTARFSPTPPLAALRNSAITISLARDGTPVTDLEPFLGETGHLIIVSEDSVHFVHSHPVATPGSAPGRGPDVTFLAQCPAPGLYKSWAQFQRGGRIITVPFTFRVQPAGAPPG